MKKKWVMGGNWGPLLYEHTFLTIVSLSWGVQEGPQTGPPKGPLWGLASLGGPFGDPFGSPNGSPKGVPKGASQTGSKAYWEAPKDPKTPKHPQNAYSTVFSSVLGVWRKVHGGTHGSPVTPSLSALLAPSYVANSVTARFARLVRWLALGCPASYRRHRTP